MPVKNCFSDEILAALRKEKIMGLRAGKDPTHQVIGVWMVLVEKRLFIRSYSLKPRSWWRKFLEEPYGSIFLGNSEVRIRAIQTRSDRLKDLVSRAYKEKDNTPGSVHYVNEMSSKKSRDTTTELAPV